MGGFGGWLPTSPGGGAASASRYGVRVRRTAPQSIPTATWTAVAFTTEDFDDGGLHDNSTNPSRLTAVEGGTFLLTANIGFVANATGLRYFGFRKNGTGSGDPTSGLVAIPPQPGGGIAASASSVLALVAGDYVEVAVYQNSGGSLNLDVYAGNPNFSMTRLAS